MSFSLPVFYWVPDFTPTEQRAPRMRSVESNGFAQAGVDGLNADLQTWSLTWTDRETGEATAIANFLRSVCPAGLFFCYSPDGQETFVARCSSWTRRETKPGLATVTATFAQSVDAADELGDYVAIWGDANTMYDASQAWEAFINGTDFPGLP